MSDEKRVLVIDNHLDMIDFLRSVLELTTENCLVSGVQSAEEGAQALKQSTFNLMIADINLRGIRGNGLVRQARRLWPDMRVILISDSNSETDRKEALELGAYRLYTKPLDTDALIYSVYKVLHSPSSSKAISERSSLPRVQSQPDDASPQLLERLEALRADTGAIQLLLANLSGDVIMTTAGTGTIDLMSNVDNIADNVRESYQLGYRLGNKSPFAIQYLSGENYELYTASINPGHWLALLFDIQTHRSRIGTIWFFTQKAIPDLDTLLREVLKSKKTYRETPTSPADVTSGDERVVSVKVNTPRPEPKAVPTTFPVKVAAIGLEEQTTVAAPPSKTEISPGADKNKVPERELEKRPSVKRPIPAEKKERAADETDVFWEQALAEEIAAQPASTGISYEEAVRLGLLQTDSEKSDDD